MAGLALTRGAGPAADQASEWVEVQRKLLALESLGPALAEGQSVVACVERLSADERVRVDAELSELIASHPRVVELYQARATLRVCDERLAEAEQDLCRAQALAPGDAGILVARASVRTWLGREAEAQGDLARARALDPGYVAGKRAEYAARAAEAYAGERYAEAVNRARSAAVLGEGADVLELEAQALVQLGQAEAAARTFAAAEEQGTLSVEARYLQALVLHQRGDLEGACAALEAAVAQEPRPDCVVELAKVLRQLGRTEEAEAVLGRVPVGAAEHPSALGYRALLRAQRGAYAEALADLELALETPGGLSEAQRQEALELRAGLQRTQPGRRPGVDPDVQLAWAEELARQGKLAEADGLLTRLLEAFPEREPEVLRGRVAVRRALGASPGLEADLLRLLELDPGDWQVAATLVWLYGSAERFERALEVLDRTLARAPGAGQAHLRRVRGEVLRGLERVEDGLAEFEQALALGRQPADIHVSRAACLARLGRMDASRAALDLAVTNGAVESLSGHLEQLHAADPEDRATHLLLVRAWIRSGRLDEGRRALEALIADGGLDVEALRVRGDLRALERDGPGALADYRRALELDPEHAPTWRVRATLELYGAAREESLGSLTRALELEPEHAATRLDRAAVLGSLGRPAEVLAELDRAPTLRTGEAETLRAKALVDQQRYDEALAAAERALDSDESGPEAGWVHARALWGLGRREEARQALEAHVRRYPSHDTGWLTLAGMQHEAGLLDPARSSVDRALALRETDEALALRARIHAAGDRGAEALADLERAIELARERPSAQARYLVQQAEVRVRLRRFQQALADCDRALGLAQEDWSEVRLWRGMALASLGDRQAALGELRRAVQLDPQSLEARISLAEVLAQLGDTASALRELDRALRSPDLPPKTREGAEALRRRLQGRGE